MQSKGQQRQQQEGQTPQGNEGNDNREKENRRADRVATNVKAIPNFVDAPCRLSIANISELGLLLEADAPLAFKGTTTLEISIPELKENFTTNVMMVRQDLSPQGRYLYGMEFLDLPKQRYDQILQHQDDVEANIKFYDGDGGGTFHFILYPNFKTFDLFKNPRFSILERGVIFLQTSLTIEAIDLMNFHFVDGVVVTFPCSIMQRIDFEDTQGYQVQLHRFSMPFLTLFSAFLDEEIAKIALSLPAEENSESSGIER